MRSRKRLLVMLSSFLVTFTITCAQAPGKLYPFSNGTKYGLVDASKNLVVDYQYEFISVFKNGTAVVKKDGKFGLINSRGKEIVIPAYDAISQPEKGFSVVTKGDSSNVTDTASRLLSAEWYYKVEPAGSGFYRLEKRCLTGGSYIRNTITHYGLEASIGLHRDSVWFSDILVGYLSPTCHVLDGIWFSGGETLDKGRIKVAVSKHTFYADTLGTLSPRNPDPCDRSIMNVLRPDEWPKYPGGNDSISSFLNRNFKFPENLQVYYHNAKVIVAITIDREGNVSSARVVKSVSAEYDAAAVDVLLKMARWEPAKYNGTPVCVEIEFPFGFTYPGMH